MKVRRRCLAVLSWSVTAINADKGGMAFVSPGTRRYFGSYSTALGVDTSTAESVTTSSSEKWLNENIEKEANANAKHAGDEGAVVGPNEVLVYDTSLRDGTQGESISASCDDKIKIANRLSSFGVDYIEAGWPGSNPKDAEFFSRAQTELSDVAKSKLVAFGSTRRKSTPVEQDNQIQMLIDSKAPTVCIVAKSHLWQVTDIIRATPEQNLQMISDSVAYLTSKNIRVFIDLEHFFEGYKFDEDYALQCCQAAVSAGAKGLVLCDTNGGSMPWDVAQITSDVAAKFPQVTIGMHAHNDCGMAVANSLMAAKSGAGMIQGTINGIGERTGNADLCSIVPSLSLHVHSNMTCNPSLPNITSLSRFIDETLNRSPNSAAPYVGASAFAHKGGLHVAAMERSPMSYQHIDPALVGNEKRVLVSELSGRQNIMGKFKDAGLTEHPDDDPIAERATAILNHVKRLESIGYTFEGADASVHLMILHSTRGYCPPFRVLDYGAQVYDNNMDSASRVLYERNSNVQTKNGFGSSTTTTARATVKVRTLNLDDEAYTSGDEPLAFIDRLEVSDGNGPVDALCAALKRALVPSHPYLNNVELTDYKVRILDPEMTTGAATRVMIDFKDTTTEESWTTVSVDRNVISASLNALVDGFEFGLVENTDSCLLCDDAYTA